MRTYFGISAVIVAATLGWTTVFAQEHASAEPHYRWALAGFIGATRAHSENESTLGIEAGYVINREWSVGAVVERSDRSRDTTLFLAGLGWHPFGPALRIQFGVGSKDPSGRRERVYRLGVGYELEVQRDWFVKPYIAADFIENEDNEWVFGLYLGRGL